LPIKPETLWDYATGAVERPLTSAGSNVRAAVSRWRDLFRDDSVNFEAEGLLDGADDAEARTDLLRQLYASGVPLDELRQAVEQDRLALLPVEAVLRATGEHTLREMSDGSGLAEDVMARRIRALGISKPDSDTVMHDDAIAAAKALKELEDSGMPEDVIDDICRTVGRSTERMADGIREGVGNAFIETGDTERDLGLRYAAAARRMIPVFTPLIEFTLTMHLLKLIRSDVVSRTERAMGTLPAGREIAVAFIDMTDFTRLSQQLRPDEVGDLGRAVAREGDWHGSPVNIASRLSDVAPPGRIFATEAVREALGDGVQWEDTGTERLKGIDDPVRVFCLAP
jgi:adenylate cyclase